ncbi:MAG: hypothetical protein IT442_18175 [Phycisphaeraceae bacterium]|nr:hypothetical protein [Phycisphaeraceae bacterium]
MNELVRYLRTYPDVAYKYTNREHAESMLRDRLFRIGTLRDYNDTQKHGTSVGDPDESRVHTSYWATDMPDRMKNDPMWLPHINMAKEDFGDNWDKGFLLQEIGWMDCYVYSMSLQLHRHIMQRLGYDAVVKISNVRLFSQLLMSRMVDLGFVDHLTFPMRCVYSEAKMAYSDDRLAKLYCLLAKDHAYAYQDEIRAYGFSGNGPIRPQVISAPGLAAFCRIVREDEIDAASKGPVVLPDPMLLHKLDGKSDDVGYIGFLGL